MMCVCLCPANFKVFARFENCLSKSYRGGEKKQKDSESKSGAVWGVGPSIANT